jgi:adenylate cyclase
MQREMATRNAGVPPDERIEYRMGVNLGDIMVQGREIAGDGVNVASRLESLADAGAICVSSAVREQVHGQLDAELVDIGEQQVKNIQRPIRVYRVVIDRSNGAARVPATSAAAKTRSAGRRLALIVASIALAGAFGVWTIAYRSDRPQSLPLSVALIPLTESGADVASSRSAANALTNDLAVALGRSVRYAPLVAMEQRDSLRYAAVDSAATARVLRSRYVVTGDVRHEAGSLAVTLHLSDGETGTQPWSTRVALPEMEISKDPSTMINRLTWRLRNALRTAENARALTARYDSSQPSDLVARAYAIWRGDLASMREARKLFDTALRIESSHVEALLGRAWTLNHEYEDDPRSDRDRIVAEMEDLSRRAIAVDPGYSRAWNTLGTAFVWQGRYDSGLEANARAIGLDPANKDSLINRGWIMDVSGQAHRAPALVEQAHSIDPETYSYELNEACEFQVLLAQFEKAAQSCAQAAALEEWSQDQVWLVAALAQLGDSAGVESAKRELTRRQPGFTVGGFRAQRRSQNPVYVEQVERNLFAGLRKAGLPE